jgi:DNA processing protein
MDAGSDGDGGDGRGYSIPRSVARLPVAELLAGSSRESITERQLGLLANVVRDAGSAVDVAGDTSLLQRRCISVVGARKVTREGAARARRLARELVASGVVVVSGLAEGVDTEAMSAAIDAGGRVVGVIGTPLDRAYPAKNKRLQELVYREHLLVSQFPQGSRVFQSNFPARNRLMALLSDATVVVEASDTSGSLHQAVECQRLGRWLFIARSVIDDKALEWPQKFLRYERCRPLERTDEMLATVYSV